LTIVSLIGDVLPDTKVVVGPILLILAMAWNYFTLPWSEACHQRLTFLTELPYHFSHETARRNP